MPLSWKRWLAALAIVAAACWLSILFLDMPVARFFAPGAARWTVMGNLGSSVLIGLITLTVLPLVILRLARGSLSDFAETVVIAGAAAIGAFTVNDFILKRLFGRDGVWDHLGAQPYAGFHWLGGDMNASFPSGHSVLIATGLFVFARVYPRHLPLVLAVMSLLAFLLLLGDWHFLSDILAGMFLGALAGSLAGEVARSHFERKRAR